VRDQAVQALRSILATANPKVRRRAVRTFSDLGLLEPIVEVMVHSVSPATGWHALSACQKVLDSQPLSQAEGAELANLVKRQPDDALEQLEAREWLFNWLWSSLVESSPRFYTDTQSRKEWVGAGDTQIGEIE
jgi:hypothetical protein